MQYPNEEAFAKAFRAAEPEGLYFLFGSENYLIDRWAKKIRQRVLGEDGGFNFQKLDGRRLSAAELFDATEAMPLMAEKKCVLIDELELAKLPADDQNGIGDVLADLNPACVLIIAAKSPGFDQKSAAAKKLLKLSAENGAAVELGSRGAAGLITFVTACAKKYGCEISREAARHLLDCCDNEMAALANEAAKACAFAGEGSEILKSHIDAVAIKKTEAKVFDLSKAVLAGNSQRALEILAGLFYLREQPVAILGWLNTVYVDLYRAAAARAEGKNAADMTRMFGYKSDYRVRNAFSSRLSAKDLRKALNILLECDSMLKSTGVAANILLEQTVVRLLALGRTGERAWRS